MEDPREDRKKCAICNKELIKNITASSTQFKKKSGTGKCIDCLRDGSQENLTPFLTQDPVSTEERNGCRYIGVMIFPPTSDFVTLLSLVLCTEDCRKNPPGEHSISVCQVTEFPKESRLSIPLKLTIANGIQFNSGDKQSLTMLEQFVDGVLETTDLASHKKLSKQEFTNKCNFVLIVVDATTMQIQSYTPAYITSFLFNPVFDISLKNVQQVCSLKKIIEAKIGPRSVKLVITNVDKTNLDERIFRTSFAKEGKITSADLAFVSKDPNTASEWTGKSLKNLRSLFLAMESMVLK